MEKDHLLSVRDLTVVFERAVADPNRPFWKFWGHKKEQMKAVDSVSFDIKAGEFFCVLGESGCGKTTLLRALLGQVPVAGGTILMEGKPLESYSVKERAKLVQTVFQDAGSSLNPQFTIKEIIAEPLEILYKHLLTPRKIADRVFEVMAQVGLADEFAEQYIHQLSGGQVQRVAIARALSIYPKILLCDEPVAALDISIQAQIINLLLDLNEKSDITFFFITHDLGVVRRIADRIMLLYLGKVVEFAEAHEIYNRVKHPYMASLIESIPKVDPDAKQFTHPLKLKGEVPSGFRVPSGCAFHPRCFYAKEECSRIEPELLGKEHKVRCLRSEEPGWVKWLSQPLG